MFGIPNESDAAYPEQATLFSADLDALAKAAAGDAFVLSGCEVTAKDPESMYVAVAAGAIYVNDGEYSISGGDVQLDAADATRLRIDIIYADSGLAIGKSTGTWDDDDNPIMPGPPANSVILAAVAVPANATEIASDQIIDKRVLADNSRRFYELVAGKIYTGTQSGAKKAISGSPTLNQSAGTNPSLYGLYLEAMLFGSSNVVYLYAAYLGIRLFTTSTITVTEAGGLWLSKSHYGSNMTITNGYGIKMDDLSWTGMATYTALKIADIAYGTTKLLMEIGPATPYLRLVGGSDPAAGDTNLYIKVGSSLMQIYSDGGTLKVK